MRIPISIRGLIPVALVVGLLLAGFAAPVALTRAQDDGPKLGDLTVTIAREDVPTDVANGSMAIGRWRLGFSADGTYQAERLDVGVLVEGTYKLDKDTLIITDESGLLSCANPAAATGGQDDVSSGTYTVAERSGRVTFVPIEDGCALRKVLLTTHEFTAYIACTTQPLQLGSVDADVTPASATPVAEGASPLDVLSLDKTAVATEDANAAGTPDATSVDDQIDGLLGQLTACWATGDPARFLPLMTDAFRAQFLSGTEEEQQASLDQLRAAMQVPFTWERAGEVTMDGDTKASAVVRTTALDQEEFVRYLFALENGQWRWDGTEG